MGLFFQNWKIASSKRIQLDICSKAQFNITLLQYFNHIMDANLLFRSKAFKKGDKLSDSQGFILMAFVNDVVGDNVREGVGEDKEHM